jgi:hypothetical protein
MNLDFMPSPVPDRPGLLIRDPFQYSDTTLIIPPALVQTLELFDGEATELDLKKRLVEITGELDVSGWVGHLTEALSQAGFLHDEHFEQMRDARHRAFSESPVRLAAHAGTAYPDDEPAMRQVFDGYLNGAPGLNAVEGPVLGIAAPHVSPEGGYHSYRDAYSALPAADPGHTFVILGTSHYGQPERFGLTRKNFVTPFGEAVTDVALADELARNAPAAIEMEDFVHSTEHSIEFQVAFLQHRYGPNVRIAPILCGPFAKSIYEGGMPEDDDGVRRFFGALGEIAARERDRITFVLGVDMAHMGRRYGDRFSAAAGRDEMMLVDARDRGRIERINAGDADGYWELVRERQDDLKWCGSAPFYTFLRTAGPLNGELRRYEQWNIDEESVVSFAAMAFCPA